MKRFLSGTGIEIGALHQPVNLEKTDVQKVLYVDSLPIEALRAHYPELKDLSIVSPDIVDDGATLSSIDDGSLDFIVANHLIEHLDNPLQALENWFAKLKNGGVLFMAVPDKRYTFDINRPVTPIVHLIEDYQAGDEERKRRNHAHYVETAELIENRNGQDAADRVESLIARDYSIHHHVWTFESFETVLDHLIEKMKVPYRIVDYSSPMPGGNEFIFILGKGEQFRNMPGEMRSTFDFHTAFWAFHSNAEKSVHIIRQEGLKSFLHKLRVFLYGRFFS